MIDKELKKFVKESLKEDIKSGDHTSLACIDIKNNSSAILLAKDNGIIAGIELGNYIFNEVDSRLNIKSNFKDGNTVKKGDIILNVSGNTQSILKAERLVLNCAQDPHVLVMALVTHDLYFPWHMIHLKLKFFHACLQLLKQNHLQFSYHL